MKLFLLKIYKILPVWLRFKISYFLADKFVVGMVAFVVKDKKLLLMNHSYQYSWGLPGGWMKRGEDLTSVMEREIEEEIGMKVKVVDIFEVRSVKYQPVIDVVVVCKVVSGKIKVDQVEVEEAKFFPLNALPKNIIKTHKPYIEKYLKTL
jgi:8-oxo-dGTP diphosphatase